ncbi:MAG TPA: NAD(FAD)-utilizing dehydrogenase [Mogibacterium sp.]|nr:NAD(FAD)-utilizing dehydrogenase [Mogibacterium sp.]
MYHYRLSEIKTGIDVPMESLQQIVAEGLGVNVKDIEHFEIRRKSIDSRKKPDVKFVYTFDFYSHKDLFKKKNSGKGSGKKTRKKGYAGSLIKIEDKSERIREPICGSERITGRPIIVGMGPCGIFAGLELARRGYAPIIIERGPAMNDRVHAVNNFNKEGFLNPEANLLYGEGGAGTFSDGKLATGIKDGLIRKVLKEFADAGAGDEIMYLAKPHVGTDVLRSVIVNLRKKIEELGGEVRFNTRLEALNIKDRELKSIETISNKGRVIIETNVLILAIGHSARDTFKIIKDAGLEMQQKPFSIGVRMEHPQALIDEAQYGKENAGKLPPAEYKISYKAKNGRGVYSFCMCPGGEVVVCTTKDGELCVNGMSNRKRDSGTANSGILCDVRTEDFEDDDVLAGVSFQEKYERLAFRNGGGRFKPPFCSMKDFLDEKSDKAIPVINSLPEFAVEAIREAVPEFAKKINGYDAPEAIVTATETRSSSPIRIIRNSSGESNIKGIYPAGEGAGYAGGITSASCDGIRAAWNIIERFANPNH